MSRLTIESASGTRRVRWYAVVALVLAPLLVAGVVLLAVHNADDRLSGIKAAIVNSDAGTTINGQAVPLGRQLTAGIVKGSTKDTGLANYDWQLTDTKDAKAGLADGTYAAVVTIPKNFSKNAVSYSDAATAKQATVEVQTSDKERVADGVISTYIANTAASVFGTSLSKSYLDNIYIGFNTLNTQLGTAADGAQKLASGTEQSASGAKQLASGGDTLASGTTELANGLTQLSSGTRASANGAATLSTGMKKYTGGVSALADGLTKLSAGAKPLPAAASQLAAGSTGIATAVQTIAQLAAANPTMTLAELDAVLYNDGNGAHLSDLATGANSVATGLTSFSDGLPALTGGIAASASGAQKLAAGGTPLASGTASLASGLDQLADGTDASASGAQQLASGTTTYAAGVSKFAAGSTQLADGTASLADGLDKAVSAIPTYSKADRTTLANVVTAPVATESASVSGLVARSGMPLLISLALWLGAFAVFLVAQAASRRALTSRRSSGAIAATSYLPGLIIGVVQGIAIAILAQFALQLDAGHWFALAGVAALTGAVFAAVIQGLVALFGNGGRLVAALAAAVALAAGIVSTAPALLLDVAGFLPTAAASTAVSAVVSGTGSAGGAVFTLVLWGLFGFVLSVVGVLRRRTVSVRQLSGLATS